MIDLKDKQLKYTSEITEKIFDQIIEKITKEGYSRQGGYRENYSGFKEYGSLYFYKTSSSQVWSSACVNNGSDVENIIVSDILPCNFPFKVGDTIRCDDLHTWSGKVCGGYPIGTCDRKEVIIEAIGEDCATYTPFQARYKDKSYGFSYNSDNSYSLVKTPLGNVQKVVPFLVSSAAFDITTSPMMISVSKI
jgi:hypothetical protein